MCLIIHKPADKTVPEDILRRAFKYNDDGWGILTRDPNSKYPISVVRGVSDFDKFKKRLTKVSDKELVIHFRIKTHGKVNKRNCHPLKVVSGLYVAHNGVLGSMPIEDSDLSDTAHFALRLGEQIKGNPQIIHDKTFLSELESKIGFSNKLVFADKDGIEIVNERMGTEVDGIWYSNSTSLFPKPLTSSYYGYSYSSQGYLPRGNDWPDQYHLYGEDFRSFIFAFEHYKTRTPSALRTEATNYPGQMAFFVYHMLRLYNYYNIKSTLADYIMRITDKGEEK